MPKGVSFEIIEKNRGDASKLTNFLYKDGRKRQGFKDDLNLEDCLELLQKIERLAYDQYEYAIRGGSLEDDERRVLGEIESMRLKCDVCKMKFVVNDKINSSVCPSCLVGDLEEYMVKHKDVVVEFWFGENWRNERVYPHNTQMGVIDRDYREFLEQKVDDIRSDSGWYIQSGTYGEED